MLMYKRMMIISILPSILPVMTDSRKNAGTCQVAETSPNRIEEVNPLYFSCNLGKAKPRHPNSSNGPSVAVKRARMIKDEKLKFILKSFPIPNISVKTADKKFINGTPIITKRIHGQLFFQFLKRLRYAFNPCFPCVIPITIKHEIAGDQMARYDKGVYCAMENINAPVKKEMSSIIPGIPHEIINVKRKKVNN